MNIQWIIASLIITVIPSSWIIQETGDYCWEIGGEYISWTNRIYICDTKDIEFYKWHEIWHYIWERLPEKTKQKYIILHKSSNQYYRAYGKDVEEDFCDNLALLMTKENSTPQVHKRIRFIKNIIWTYLHQHLE